MTRLYLNIASEEVQAICKKDPQLEKLIHTIGDLEIGLRKNYFEALVSAIVSQQISVKAAKTIYGRLSALVNVTITPEAIANLEDEAIREAGISKQKLSYLRDLTTHFQQMDIASLETMENKEVIKALTNIKGIGKWTAEIFLLFSLGRLDVLPADDVGLHRAVRWLYALDPETNGKKALQEREPNWEGAQTVASLYLWEAVNREYVLQYSNIEEVVL